jgi:4-hydroxy-tetrahydrodipicolinate synthase
MFEGSAVALITPFTNEKIDFDALNQLMDFQFAAQTECILVCGTTGESATLAHDEHKQLIRHCSEYIRAKRGSNPYPLLMAGTGSNSTKEALELTQYAKETGADCALLISPYYNKPTQKGLLHHFSTIAREVDIPQILYNIQSRTGVNIDIDTMDELSKEKNIIGVKEASGDLHQISETVRRTSDDFRVWSGDDALTLPILSLGGKGVISVAANIIPKDIRAMVHAFLQGDSQQALERHQRMAVLNSTLFIETNPIPIKTAVNILSKAPEYGLPYCGGFRSPMIPIQEKNLQQLAEVMSKYGLPV